MEVGVCILTWNGNLQRTRLRRMKQDGRMRVVDQSSHSLRDVVQSGRTLALGVRGRWFKSSHLDNVVTNCYNLIVGIVLNYE